MALATTAKFEEMAIEVETAVPGTYARVCGLVDATVTYTSTVEESMVPDCANDALPMSIERTVTAIDWSATASGVWAQESHEMMFQWWKAAAVKNVRIVYAKAAVGDVEFVTGAAILAKLEHPRAKGKRVEASIELVAAGAVTTTDQA